jgi:2'-5' RNA ligase
MRVFVAVRLSDAVIAAAQDVASALRRRVRPLPARWVSAANMHLTVCFIGSVAADAAPAILAALQPPLAIPPFRLELGDGGMFPPTGPPRVIWIGLSQGAASLRAMHDAFARRLAPLGFEPEQRPYSAHLTLARLKEAPRSARAEVQQALAAIGRQRASCPIDSATVFESRLSPKGASYQPLFDVPCAG